MRTPKIDMKIFKERRNLLAATTQGSAVVIPAHPEFIRNNDAHYSYRQDTNLYYLTGFEEPGSVLVFRPGMQPETVLFIQPKDITMETWTGFRYGPDAAQSTFKVDQAISYDKLETELPKLLKEVESVHYSMYINREFDALMMKVIENISLGRSRTNKGNLTIKEARVPIGELRIQKTPFEIEQMRKACLASSEAHVEVMKSTKPGVSEQTLHGIFIKSIMERGCAREGYGSIVATGANATTLHYVFNDQICRDNELLLVDAGGEYNYYTGDITRVYPVNGKFNTTQKRVYQKMLDLQKTLVSMVKPGFTREGLQKEAISMLTDLMIDENLLKGKRDTLIEKKEYFKYYPHGVGHWLGLDVHDAGLTELKGEPRPLAPGMVLTIEPGLYIPQDTKDVPKELCGMGIRIEDDILVTETGHENMTAKCPKEIHELEALVGRA